MTRTKQRARAAGLAAATSVALSLSLLCSQGCALAIPRAWRAEAPVPLAGPISHPAGTSDAHREIPTEDLAAQVDADQQWLIDRVADTSSDTVAENRREESRAVAARLPGLQSELERRGENESGPRARHPTIR